MISHPVLLIITDASGNIVGKIKTHILCSMTFFSFFLFENGAVYEIKWRNIVEPYRPQMTIRRMRISYWIPKTINTY